jgi:hypothetical protein
MPERFAPLPFECVGTNRMFLYNVEMSIHFVSRGLELM